MPKDELPIPDTRSERLLNSIATGEDVADEVEIISDMDKYLYYIAKNGSGGGKPVNTEWGKISGSIANQTDLSNQLDSKADAEDLKWGKIQGSIANQTDLVGQLSSKATTSDLNALHVQVNSKANSSDLEALSTTVASKASLADLDVLSATVAGKASSSDLEALYTTVENLNTTVENLETTVADKADHQVFTATLSASGWGNTSPFRQTVTVSGILGTDNPIVDIVPTNDLTKARNELQSWGCVSTITTSDNLISVVCFDEKPTANMSIRMQVIR